VIAILDYGSGNLRSAQRAFERSGEEVVVTSDRDIALNAAGLVVPGVGAFAACMRSLVAVGGDEIVRERVAKLRPTLGICVGMQILFRDGDEHSQHSPHEGVDIWHESVSQLQAPILPHMGWNTVEVTAGSQLFNGLSDQSFYFVHSYAAKQPVGKVQAWSLHGERFLAAVEDGAIAATQFHPEKSGDAGLALIKNWVELL